MDILEFAGEVIVLSMSGVLSPGPLFLANLIYGSKQGYYAGIKIANGHMAVELLLIILSSLSIFGLSHFTVGPAALRVVGMIGGVAIILFFCGAIVENINMKYLGTLEHPLAKMIIENTKKGTEAVIEIAPKFFSAWDFKSK
jgi:threonine/homoserine/homoserine lactone efflux protein